MTRWFLVVAAAWALSGCKGWDSDKNLSAMNADELRALCTYGYEASGGAAAEKACTVEAGGESTEVTFVLGTHDTEVSACVNATQPDCKASLLEACWDAMAGDLCNRVTSSQCNDYTNCVNGF
jgi:hypothetical protein